MMRYQACFRITPQLLTAHILNKTEAEKRELAALIILLPFSATHLYEKAFLRMLLVEISTINIVLHWKMMCRFL